MCRIIKIPLDDLRGHLVEPPVIDSLTVLGSGGPFAIVFIPDPHTSAAEKETVTVDSKTARNRPEVERIAVRLQELADRLHHGVPIDRIIHGGGGDFAFYFTDGYSMSLSDAKLDSGDTLWAYTRIQDVAVAAEIAYRLAQPTAA